MKVLITTSGIGSRLGNLTKFTNKGLVRVGKKPALSYILDNYPDNTEFVITLGHYGHHVRQYIKVAHHDLNVSFVEVDRYEGEGSSLLYSIYCAKNLLNEPFVFHACDSVVKYEKTPLQINSNWLGGFKSSGSSHYRTFNVRGDKVSRLNEKGEKTSDYDYIGICGIKDHLSFWRNAKEILERGGCPSDYEVIVGIMSDGFPFDAKVFGSWSDIGNIDSLKEARKSAEDSFDLLDKDDESIFMLDGRVIKFFYDETTCANRVKRAMLLGDRVPQLLASSQNFYAYKHADGTVLPKTITPRKMQSLLNWAKKTLWCPVADDGTYGRRCEDFYRVKTIQRINKFLHTNGIEDKEEMINGELVAPALDMVKRIDFSSLVSKTPTLFHGDFILENILESNGRFTLLDWRQDFGGSVDFGDFHYDLAKLNHNLTLDHSAVHMDLFYCGDDGDGVRCQIMVPSINNDCRSILRRFCLSNDIDYANICILTAIVWLNMSPLHEHPLDKFLYYFGRYHLHMALKGNANV